MNDSMKVVWNQLHHSLRRYIETWISQGFVRFKSDPYPWLSADFAAFSAAYLDSVAERSESQIADAMQKFEVNRNLAEYLLKLDPSFRSADGKAMEKGYDAFFNGNLILEKIDAFYRLEHQKHRVWDLAETSVPKQYTASVFKISPDDVYYFNLVTVVLSGKDDLTYLSEVGPLSSEEAIDVMGALHRDNWARRRGDVKSAEGDVAFKANRAF